MNGVWLESPPVLCRALAAVAWRLLKPFCSGRAQEKVAISRGVPAELTRSRGGEAAVDRMIASVPVDFDASQAAGPHTAPQAQS